MEYVNDCWQCDTSHGPVITVNGEKRKTYLIQVIDDASRLIVGHEFFWNDNSINFQKVLKQAIKTYGVPKKVFVDNGTPYKNLQFQTICANIGTILIHSKPYTPQGKGKIERSFRTVKDNFVNCSEWSTFLSLEDLNTKYSEYVDFNYNNHEHSGINTTPRKRFTKDFDKIKFIEHNSLEYMFLHSLKRTVSSDATINLHKNLFEVPGKYMKQQIMVRYSPDDLDIAYIYDENGNMKDIIKPVDKVANSNFKRESISYE
ncbi:MAG: DDE-type integrase/transposase/recombinase [Mycoplasmatota bacterium]